MSSIKFLNIRSENFLFKELTMDITTRNNEKNIEMTNNSNQNINDIPDETPIQRFYYKTNIFITGGTGVDFFFYKLWTFHKVFFNVY